MSNPWVSRNQNTIYKLWVNLGENSNVYDYWQEVLILRSIFEQASLVKFNLENSYNDMSSRVDFVDNVAYCNIRFADHLQNQNDFIEVAKNAKEVLNSVNQDVKDGKRTDRGEGEGKRTVDIRNHCNTLIDKVANKLGLQRVAFEKKLLNEDYKTQISKLIDKEIENDGRGLFSRKGSVNKSFEEARKFLAMAYKQRACSQMNEILSLFEAEGETSRFNYLAGYVEEVQKHESHEEIVKIQKQALWKTVKDTNILLAIDHFKKSPNSIYKYLKILDPNIRKYLWNVNKKDEELYEEGVKYEDCLEWEKIIKENLSEEQIKQLFYFPEEPKPKTKEQLQKELKDAQQRINVRTGRLEALENRLELFQQQLTNASKTIEDKEKEKENYQFIIYQLYQQIQELSQQRNEELSNTDRDIDQLEDDLEEKEAEIESLNNDLDKHIRISDTALQILKYLATTEWRNLNPSLLVSELIDAGINFEDVELGQDISYWQLILTKFWNLESQLEEKDQHILNYYLRENHNFQTISELRARLIELRDEYNKLTKISEDYYKWSQNEIWFWKTTAETHDSALKKEGEKNRENVQKLQEQTEQLKETLEKANTTINQLDQKIADLEDKKDDNSNSGASEEFGVAHKSTEEREQVFGFSESDLWKVKDSLEDQTEETNKWIKKYWNERKRFINHDVRLAEETKRNQKLRAKYIKRGKTIEELWQEIKELKGQKTKVGKQKDKVETRLGEQVNNLHKLEESKDKAIRKLKLKLDRANKTIEIKEDQIEDLEWKLEVRTEQRNRARQKLRVIKHNKKKLKEKAEDKGVCLTLIKYEDISKKYLEDNDNSLVKAVKETSHDLVDVIIDIQDYLGVGDLTQIETSHPMPEGKNLRDLIEFYNNPPIAVPTNTYIEVPKEIPVEVPTIIEKPVKKIKVVETPFGEDLEKIIQIDLKGIEKELEIDLPEEIKQILTKATNYQQLSTLRNSEIKKYLQQQKAGNINTSIEPVPQIQETKWHWWWVLIILLAIKGLIITGLAVKLNKSSKKKIK